MKEYLRKIAHNLIEFVHIIIGIFILIKKNKVFFDSYPDYSDNCRAMSDYLLKNSNYKIYWAVNTIPSTYEDNNIIFVKKTNKLSYIYHTLSSKYLFSTHGAFSWANKKRQVFHCFWHGTMLKKIACMQNPIKNKYYNSTVTSYSAPSDYYIDIVAKSFGRSSSDVIVTGYPRIDFLLNENDSMDKLGIDINKYKKIIMYLPTFRQPTGGGYVDSIHNVFKDDFIDFTDEKSLKVWNEYFKKLGMLLIVKPHPSDKNQLQEVQLSNIINLPHQILLKKDIQLYNILHYTDALITDFSSVYCDYLVLNKPIGFILSDINEYGGARGFVFKKTLEMLPGSKIFNESDFRQFILDVSQEKDITRELRQRLQPMYNKYTEGCFCERIARMLKMKINI